MNSESSVTETVIRNHLQAFLEQKGIAAILSDYDEDARFYSETEDLPGKQEIHRLLHGLHRFSARRGPLIISRSGASESTETSPISPGAWA